MSFWVRDHWKVLAGAAILLLVGYLVAYDIYVTQLSDHRKEQIDYMSAESFRSWLGEIKSVGSILGSAETNVDAKEAMNYTFAAVRFATILEWTIEVSPRPPDFAEHLYLHMAGASIALNGFVSGVATQPPTTQRNLDSLTIQRFANVTATIQSLAESVGFIGDGIDPVQHLREKGVLDQVIVYLEQIRQISSL